MMNLNDCLK